MVREDLAVKDQPTIVVGDGRFENDFLPIDCNFLIFNTDYLI